ncbi:MAG: hypothetical protein R2724_32300 [Bryobacterales bacterium]
MSKRGFEERLREIDALRRSDSGIDAEPELRKALSDKRSNFMVKKAAQVAGELGLRGLTPDLLAAYDRLFEDAVKKDPQCWGKTAIAVALKDLGYDDPEPFYRGAAHRQMEPSWGKEEDSAGALRANCIAALPGCRVDAFELLVKLTDALLDPDQHVRCEAAATIAHLGHEAGAAPLRLKARVGDLEPEVLGACLSALLALDVFDAVEFVAGFLQSPDEQARGEAYGALGAASQPEAFAALKRHWDRDPMGPGDCASAGGEPTRRGRRAVAASDRARRSGCGRSSRGGVCVEPISGEVGGWDGRGGETPG